MLEIITGKASKGYEKGEKQRQNDKTMDKYAQMKSFNYDLRLQVYMYAFKYVDPETISEEDYFIATKHFVENYKKVSTPVPVPKHWLRFSYIRL